jgi:hypothetical protein
MAKETAIKMHLYVANVELTELQAHTLIKMITDKISSNGYPITFQIHEVEVIDNE